ncbi:hypothetical protein CEXT_174411, partial [Caerostris extrusa]
MKKAAITLAIEELSQMEIIQEVSKQLPLGKNEVEPLKEE